MATYADHPFRFFTTPNHLLSKDPSGGEVGPPVPPHLQQHTQKLTIQPDVFTDLASEMAMVHGLITRYLNSIYLQAPHIPATEQPDFCRYMLAWHELVHIHHTNEETDFFPAVEALAGEVGIMEANVAQHQAFEAGMASFKQYVDDVIASREEYDGNRVIGLIDAFGDVLMRHLEDEIETLLALKRFGKDKMKDVYKKAGDEAAKGMKAMSFATLATAWANLDADFEGGAWKSWPLAPAPMKFFITTVLWRLYGNLTKFGASDRHGKLRPLHALPKEGKGSQN
ncbi:hemerythrin HHE cation binding domain-containing protein [Echria macrotheca]|uniref:Hemerythrin HHE cation binding domain-containing protein n=1 Tax=Echria macrotheca TaxID=438768 RepID=A0AAJ0FFP2_9PEZI|nr:hemerythrin HHE cation binding domain-containing protein [Echria macrotheca]